jgi:aldehyde dehydrogenase (NAD+)
MKNSLDSLVASTTGIAEISRVRDFYNIGATKPYAFRREQLLALKRALTKYEQEICDALFKDLKKIGQEVW